MSQKTKNIASASLLLVFLLFVNISFLNLKTTLAAGINNVSINLANTTTNGTGSVAVSFEVENAIPENGRVEIEFPNEFSNLDITNSTGSNLGLNPVIGT